MDVLVQMRSKFDKAEEMANLKKQLTGERWKTGARGADKEEERWRKRWEDESKVE